MKLPNWLHRKPAEDYDTDRFDSFAASLEAQNDALYIGGPQPDPYLNSLRATPTFSLKPALQPFEIKGYNFPVPLPESAEGAHTRGYWEGRAEAGHAAIGEYRVEVRRADGDYAPIDEVLLHDADRCLVHLERIDTDHWWLTLSPTGGWDDEVLFDLFRVKKCIEVTEQ